ncbi:MAG: uroporphyrinogen-III synthase [Candidatus Kryptonium sp.]
MKVLITRDKSQAIEFASYLESFGFIPIFFPTIEIVEPDSWDEVDERIKRIDDYTDIIFTSSNGVRFFFERFMRFYPIEKLKTKRFSAVGIRTKNEIEKYGFKVETLPEKSDKENLFAKILVSEKAKFLFPRGNLTDEKFIKLLKENGFKIDDIVVYKTIKPEIDENNINEIKSMIENGEIKFITFFSPSSVRNFFEILGNVKLNGQKIAVIGETTLKECEKFGLSVNINPMEFNPKPSAKFLAELINKEKTNF